MSRKIGGIPPRKPPPQPGDVWWCDGASLAFEAYFKRRPVLVVAVESSNAVHVQPLSSKRRYGQEQAVTHAAGVSYMTGAILRVPVAALQTRIGVWEDFPKWQAEQQRIAQALEAAREQMDRWRNFFRRLWRRG